MKFSKLNPKHFLSRSKLSKPGSSFGSESTSSSSNSKNPSTDPYSYIEILKAFKLIDRDNDGAVTRQELESLLTRLGPNPPTEEEIDVMIGEVDGDGDGTIRLEELASRVVSLLDPSCDSMELFKETFEFFDADRDGFISAEELLRVFSTIGDERCTLDDCKRMIADVDVDGNGFVCFTEFSRMMDLQR